jgi:hypothetical protein
MYQRFIEVNFTVLRHNDREALSVELRSSRSPDHLQYLQRSVLRVPNARRSVRLRGLYNHGMRWEVYTDRESRCRSQDK